MIIILVAVPHKIVSTVNLPYLSASLNVFANDIQRVTAC